MKCIYTQHDYSSWGESASFLVAETREGKRSRLLSGLTLTINPEGFTITNSDKATLRQGVETDVFAIVDSMTIEMSGPLKLVMPDYSGSYEDYQNRYGYGRVPREVKSNWYVYSETPPEDATETAFGLIRFKGQKTYEIHSLHAPERLSRKERAKYIAEYILARLHANEYATVSAVNFPDFCEVEGVKMYGSKYRHKFEQCRLLFADALLRKSNVTEVFPDGQHYAIQRIYEEEIENENNEKGDD
ncbi:hypothetical protein [Virgibacillus dakarensis]|uniref:hypothetical protein n=1 Tax=Virgibacillus dakarensis TaxID=1917889 RepID=UPI000B441090|nr:hypothetical protein [Virgibacillus dakarensis]